MLSDGVLTWDEAKNKVHDASGVKKPEDWLWYNFNGVYYPLPIDKKVLDTNVKN